MSAPWIGRWMLTRHAALYDTLFFNADYDELGFDSPEEMGDPNDIASLIHEDPLGALERWSDAMIVRADLDVDPYEPASWHADEQMLFYELGSKFGLISEDIETILGRPWSRGFAYFTPDSATQTAVRREYHRRREAMLERLDGPVHNYGKQLRALRYAWLELREDGSFTAAGFMDSTAVTGPWEAAADEQLILALPTPQVGERVVKVEYLGSQIYVVTSSGDSISTYVYRREPEVPTSRDEDSTSSAGIVREAQWWHYLSTAPRLPPPPPSKRSKRKRPRELLVLRPELHWLRTPVDTFMLREGPWAPAVVELDLCALDLDSEQDVKRVLGALSFPAEPWPQLARVRVLEGFLLEAIEPFMRASPVFADVELCEGEG